MKIQVIFLLFLLSCLLGYCQKGEVNVYVDSVKVDPAWKIKISPINWFDNSSGDNLSLQLEYFTGKYGICLENNFYQNLSRDRFYTMSGNRISIELRKYKTVCTSIKDEAVYRAIEFSMKNQKYSTLGYIVNDHLDTNYFNNLSFSKKVFMLHFKVGVGGKLNSFTEIELAFGLGLRYRLIDIEGLKFKGDRVGTWMREQHGTYRWMDHEKSGLFPSIAVNLRFGININDLVKAVRR